MRDFFKLVLPETGIYCYATPLPKGGYKQYSVKTLEDFCQKVAVFKPSTDSYFAVSTFQKEIYSEKYPNVLKNFRTHANGRSIKCLFVDIDCGQEKPFETQKEGLQALQYFCKKTGFPKPTMVSSGYGIHAYWPFSQEISVDDWTQLAKKFKRLTASLNFSVDPKLTANSASVLRIPGSFNYKRGNVVPVKLLNLTDALPVEQYEKLIDQAFETYNISYVEPLVSSDNPFANMPSNLEGQEPADRELIYKECLQMQNCLTKGGNLPEPLWYASLQLERFLSSPDYHALSKGYPRYSATETEGKVAQLVDKDIGPTLCQTFSDYNDLCENCKHFGKIKSPVTLGYRATPSAVVTERQDSSQEAALTSSGLLIAPPMGESYSEQNTAAQTVQEDTRIPELEYETGVVNNFYSHDGSGVYYQEDPNDKDSRIRICDFNFYPIDRVWDYGEQKELLVIKIHTIMDGIRIISVPVSELVDSRKCKSVLANAGVTALNGLGDALGNYMLSYLTKIRSEFKATKNYIQLGWQDEGDHFVLPQKIFNVDGTITEQETKTNLARDAGFIQKKGKLEDWVKVINNYTKPGYEGYAFAHLIGYASILFQFTPYHGAQVNLGGDSGGGKTTVLYSINSIFGHPRNSMMKQGDTYNAVMKRISLMNSIAPTYDEITNIDPKELSDFCYAISQGREKMRLNSDSSDKKTGDYWKLILVSTSNSNLVQKLSLGKMDSTAESLRLFEYYVNTARHQLSKEEASRAFDPLNDNYGHAGEIFIEYVMKNKEAVAEQVRKMIEDFDREANVPIRERYWSAIIGTALTACKITKELGLNDFDFTKIQQWCFAQIVTLRANISDSNSSPESILADFMNQHVGQTYSVTSSYLTSIEPRQKLTIRTEHENGIAYIDRQTIRHWINSRGGDYNSVKHSLREMQILLDESRRIVLSKGADSIHTPQTNAWVINMKHPLIADIAPTLESVKKAVESDEVIEKYQKGRG